MGSKVNNYEITERLYESGSTLVCRGCRFGTTESLILKILKPDAATRDGYVRFKREFEMTSKLNIPCVVKVCGLEEYQSGLMMVMEDIGGRSLDLIPENDPLSLTESLEIAMILAETLGSIHRQGLIHRDINPSHIIWNTDTKQLNLIDFGIADEAPERTVSPQVPSILEETLAYISPEQTGRMNRPVDYRTDFYSLGVTFYQLLTGRLPFEADDALGIVHSHIAGTPTPPHTLRPEIPEMVSLIVMKLMAKTADERYQSAWGLKTDLGKCLRELTNEGAIQPFELGVEDFSDKLHFPQKLYGRENEIDRLLRALDRAAEGASELFLVAGYAGIGKTALVHELYRPVAEKHGYLIEGKFDQLQRNVPYFAWIRAFSGLVRYLLTESEERIANWKEKILTAVGALGRILTDVIPDLQLIIGPQPDIPALGPPESQNRFNYVFLEFIKALAAPGHPLVVFLDDLQWIDAASLDLLQTLMGSVGVSNILLIGAYRDNEVDAFHPLRMAIEALQKEQTGIDVLTLGNLSEESVNALIADTLHYKHSETIPLADLIYAKTGGNPFFLLQTLRALAEKEAIAFDIRTRCWKWDISSLKTMEITDNVAALMLGKIRKLPLETRHILPLAAHMGFRFDVSNLGTIAEQSEDIIVQRLQPAEREGLLVSLDGGYQFTHDRIQQAAYSLIPEKERPSVHLQIGRRLLSQTGPEELAEKIFDIVNHLNRGTGLITDTAERIQLAELNVAAGERARASIDYATARGFFAAAADLMQEDMWDTRYNFQFALFLNWAEAEYLHGAFEEAERLFAILLAKAKNALDRAKVYDLRLTVYPIAGRFDDAVTMAVKALQLLGVDIPEDDEALDLAIKAEAAEVKEKLKDRNIPELAQTPEATDPHVKAVIGILVRMGGPAYIGSRPQLYPLTPLKALNYFLKYGATKETGSAFSGYGFMLASVFGDPHAGFEFSELAIRLGRRFNDLNTTGTALYIHGNHVNFWLKPIATDFPFLEQGFRACLDGGNFVHANYIAYSIVWQAVERGDNLSDALDFSRKYADFAAGSRNEAIHRTIVLEQQFLKCLMGETEGSISFSDEEISEHSCIEKIAEASFTCGITYYHTMKMIAAYLTGDNTASRAHSEEAGRCLAAVLAQPIESTFSFIHALVLTRACREVAEEERREIIKTLAAYLEKLGFWAKNCPENFLCKHALVSAEIAELRGDEQSAERLFDQAVESAKANGFIHWEGMSNESAARFHKKRGLGTIARAYLREARYCYARWGAKRKVKQLDKLNPWLSEIRHEPAAIGTPSEQLDVATIIKATQTISSEIEMDRLAQTLLRIVMENAGATKGGLSVEGGDTLLAAMMPGEDKVPQIVFEPLRVVGNIPDGIFNYVRHTRETVILEDAHVDAGGFSGDKYLQHAKPKSVLCMPMQRKERLLAVLYLENNLAAGVFTPERRTMIEMLAAQAAVSLETSGLYEILRANEVRLRLGQNAAHIGAWEYDIVSERFWGSDEAKHIYGFDSAAHDFSVETVESCIPERERVHQGLVDLIESNRPYDLEFEIRPADGSDPKIISSVAELYRDEQDRPVKVYGVVHDITERKRAEAEIERLKNHLANIIDSMPTMLVGMDNHDRITRWNRQVETDTGIPARDAVGRPVQQLFPELAPYIEEMTREIRQHRPAVLERRQVEKAGERRLYDLMLYPLLSNGVAGAVLRIEDVTERSRIQEMMIQNEKMMSLGGLAAGMAHEINNPLGIISQAAQNIERRVSPELPANLEVAQEIGIAVDRMKAYFERRQIYNFIAGIREASLRASRIIQNILRFSRGAEDILKPTSPASVLDQALELAASDYDLKKKHDFKNIEIVRDYAPDMPEVPMVIVEMEQVMLNLLKNAAQAMAANSPGRKPRITIRLRREDRYALFEVADNGPGMTEEVRRRVFEPFFTTKEPGIGTGLGLSVAYMIVTQNHKGLMEVDSRPGNGACFRVRLPLG